MKKTLVGTLVAVPLLSLSSMAFAAEPVALSAAEMDSVTAGALVDLGQWNISPITVIQLNVLNYGVTTNIADIVSGNAAWTRQGS